MGHQDQFAKRTFAEQTERITQGAIAWRDPPELQLVKAQLDGQLLVLYPSQAAQLPPPWSHAQISDEVAVEIKMPGDHLGLPSFERAVLRRQARQVERIDKAFAATPIVTPPTLPLWMIAPHVPSWIHRVFKLIPLSQGCYQLHPFPFSFLWISANELPLHDNLIPFLVARSGVKLDEFGRWAMHRCAPSTFASILRYTNMSSDVKLEWWQNMPADDVKRYPAVRRRTREIIFGLLSVMPDIADELKEEGLQKGLQEGEQKGRQEARVQEAKSLLQAVLKKRGLSLKAAHKQKVRACQDVSTLERWLLQAVSAQCSDEVFADP